MASLYEMANEWSIRDLKKEYSRLRWNFLKQITRLAEAQPNNKKAAQYLKGGYKYPLEIAKIKELKGRKNWTEKEFRADWAVRVAELQGLTQAKTLSLSGQREIRNSIISSLNNAGYTSINRKNFNKFTSLMNFLKSQGVLPELYEGTNFTEQVNDWIDGGLVTDLKLSQYIEQFEAEVESIDLFG